MKRINKKSFDIKEQIIGLLMASGPFVGYLLFALLPMILSAYVSFTDMKGFDVSEAKWIGFANYKKFFQEGYYNRMFLIAIKNTLLYLISVPLNMAVSLFLANLMTKPHFESKAIRILLFIPSVCSGVGITLMWTWILQEQGVINTLLSIMGFNRIGFISTSQWFMPSVLLISLWMKGTNIVLMQSALANVNKEIKQAAHLDGAGSAITFWKIVFPLISPTLFYTLVMNLIAALQEMAIMQLVASNGTGPGFAAVTLSYFMYQMAWNNSATQGMGIASALSWILSVFIICLTVINFKVSKKWVYYD